MESEKERSLRKICYSTELEHVKDASADLIAKNAETLINYIYEHRDETPYDTAETRVGLAIKILLRATGTYSSNLLNPVVDDLKALLDDRSYIQSFAVPSERKSAIQYELNFIQRFMELDDLISLNTNTLRKRT